LAQKDAPKPTLVETIKPTKPIKLPTLSLPPKLTLVSTLQKAPVHPPVVPPHFGKIQPNPNIHLPPVGGASTIPDLAEPSDEELDEELATHVSEA
jgi:hypothetical protein